MTVTVSGQRPKVRIDRSPGSRQSPTLNGIVTVASGCGWRSYTRHQVDGNDLSARIYVFSTATPHRRTLPKTAGLQHLRVDFGDHLRPENHRTRRDDPQYSPVADPSGSALAQDQAIPSRATKPGDVVGVAASLVDTSARRASHTGMYWDFFRAWFASFCG